LLEDLELTPNFVEDWTPLLPSAVRRVLDQGTKYFSAGLVIGQQGSTSALHYDFLHTHAFLAQIVGKKRCVLYSPSDTAAMYNGYVDPDRPDFEKFPLLRKATAFECILEPGDLLFIPCDWWHHVVALEKSITVSYNFFNRVNFRAYLTDLLQNVPAVVHSLRVSSQPFGDHCHRPKSVLRT